jgi:LEA14-like dessication related protein
VRFPVTAYAVGMVATSLRLLAPVLALTGLAVFGLAACPGAQVKEGAPATGDVNVVLRRIDVVKAGLDGMDLKVIVAVENGTGGDIDVSADATIALVGESKDDGDGTGGGAEGGDDSGDSGDSDAGGDEREGDDAGATASGLDGKRHAGAGRGKATANAVSELPIFVRLPLPEDPETLEQVLGWAKARVHVAGTISLGLEKRTIGGERDVATPKLPKFKVKSAQVAKVDDGAAGEAFITLLLENPNPFEVVVDNISWRVLIADKELRTKEDGGTSIPPSSVEEYNISIPLDETAFPGKGELKALLKKPAISYRVDANFTARGLRGSEVFSGEMRFP